MIVRVRTTAARYGWAGSVLTRPRLRPETEDPINELKIAHDETLDLDPDADGGDGMGWP